MPRDSSFAPGEVKILLTEEPFICGNAQGLYGVFLNNRKQSEIKEWDVNAVNVRSKKKNQKQQN